MELKPQVSILTPVKNASAWLAECINSGLSQTQADWEWILVDDHSTDNSFAIISAIAEKDLRIRVFKNPGEGIIPALQKALDESSGSFITRMDADDLMPLGRLQQMLTALQQAPPKSVVTGLVRYFSEGAVSDGYRKYESWLNEMALQNRHWENIYRECVVASPNWMMRREELMAIGGFAGLYYPEDYDLVFRWYQHRFRMVVVPEVTLHWREHPQRTSRNSEDYQQAAFFRMKIRRFLQLDRNHERPLVLWGTGIKGRLAAQLLDASHTRFSWMGLSHKPQWLYGHEINHYSNISELRKPQLLLAVYPPPSEKAKLMTYLKEPGLEEGRDF